MEKQTENAEVLDQAVLDECKPHLRNILLHWEPKEKDLSTSTSQTVSDKPASSGLSNTTACVIFKWALKTLTESRFDDKCTLALLKWTHSTIMPHRSITDAVLSDEGVRKDLLRLFHLTAQEGTLNTLQLFSTVMLHLLEAHRDRLNAGHQTLIQTCLLTNTDDEAKKGKTATLEHKRSVPFKRSGLFSYSIHFTRWIK